jgi:hypothetical protein
MKRNGSVVVRVSAPLVPPSRSLNVLLGLGLQLLGTFLPFVALNLLGRKFVDIPLRQPVLANCPQEQLVGLQQAALLYQVFLLLRLSRLGLPRILLRFYISSQLPLGVFWLSFGL